jgi:hypothetical protein
MAASATIHSHITDIGGTDVTRVTLRLFAVANLAARPDSASHAGSHKPTAKKRDFLQRHYQ